MARGELALQGWDGGAGGPAMSQDVGRGSAGARASQSEAETAELWEVYKRTGSMTVRGRLIVSYSGLVRYVATLISARLPNRVEVADLCGFGMVGLIDAIEKFDPSRGYKFETYAVSRIKGSIIDSLRRMDWVPRGVRVRTKELERAYAQLEGELKRAPTEQELADALETTVADVRHLFDQLAGSSMVALEETASWAGASSATIGDGLAADDPDPPALFEIEEQRQDLIRAMGAMDHRRQEVLRLYYFEGLTLREIGQALKISESRACQLHNAALAELRQILIRSVI
jgi:RNA polymerase sigma factor for flagellar operon FliA